MPTTKVRRGGAQRVRNEARCHSPLCPFSDSRPFGALAEEVDQIYTYIKVFDGSTLPGSTPFQSDFLVGGGSR